MLITRRFLSEELMLRREIIHLSFGEAEHAREKPFAMLSDNKIQFGNYQGALDNALGFNGMYDNCTKAYLDVISLRRLWPCAT